jgi:hypothetical protein
VCGLHACVALPGRRGAVPYPPLALLPAYTCRYMLASLQEAAIAAGHPEWGHGGPHDSGNYNSQSFETGFFKSYGGSWDSGAAGGQPAGAAHGTHMLACFPACLQFCSQQFQPTARSAYFVCLLILCSSCTFCPCLPPACCRVRQLLPELVQRAAHPARRPAAGRHQAGAVAALPAAGDARGAGTVGRRHALCL